MKQFLVLIALIFSANLMAQGAINFSDSTYEEALQHAKKDNKLLFIFLYDLECSHCENMRKNVLTQAKVYDFLNQNFVNFKLDSKSEKGIQFIQKNKIPSFPAFLFRDSTEADVINFTGEMSANEFIEEASNALNPMKYQTNLAAAFNKDTTNGINCLAYLNSLKRSIQKDQMESIAKRYLSTQAEAQLLSVLNWKVMALGVNDLQSKEFEFIRAHKNEFIQLTSQKRFEIKVNSVVKKEMKQALDFNLAEAYFKNHKIAESLQLKSVDSILFLYDVQFYEKTKNWKAYEKVVEKDVKNFGWENKKMLNEIASNYYRSLPTKENLVFAITLAKRSNEIDNMYNSNYLIAKLYNKLKDVKNAKIYAKRAFDIATTKNIDKAEILKLYKELGMH
jgi:thioredoxin-related protein